MSARFRTFLALSLGVVTVAAAEKAATYQTGAQWLVVVAIATAFVVAVCGLGGAVWGAASTTVTASLYERRLARRDAALVRLGMLPPPPSALAARHARPVADPLRVECNEYWDAAREASAAAEPTATMPMPPVDDAAVLPVRTTQYAAAGAQWGRT